MSYGNGGFAVELPNRGYGTAWSLLQRLQVDFIDRATRAVAFSFSLYCPETDAITVCRFLADVSPTRYIEPSVEVHTVSPIRVSSLSLFVQTEWQSVLLAAFVCYFLVLEVREARDVRWQYFASFWNILEIGQLTFVLTYLGLRWAFASASDAAWSKAIDCSLAVNSCFVDLADLADLGQVLYNIAGISSLLSLFKVFKFLRLNRRMNVMWRTLRLAVWDLLAFSAIIAMVIPSLAWASVVVFLREPFPPCACARCAMLCICIDRSSCRTPSWRTSCLARTSATFTPSRRHFGRASKCCWVSAHAHFVSRVVVPVQGGML